MAATVDQKSRPRMAAPAGGNPLNRPEIRQFIYQAVLLVGLVVFFWEIVNNAITNLRRQNVAAGFDFLDRTAGFDISQTLIDYSAQSTFGQAILVGLVNTLVVSAIGIVLATLLGFVVGIARLSSNWLIARLATVYVEVARNVPLLLQLFVWYFAVAINFPPARQAYQIPGGGFLSIRGLYLPRPVAEPGFGWVLVALGIAVLASMIIARIAYARQQRTGERIPVLWISLALLLALPLTAFFAAGQPVSLDYPALRGFNFAGGMALQPEIFAMVLGLVFYTGGYIAEVVRAGIMGVGKGQKEAARALGLPNGLMMRLVVIPQALRIIIPPLTSQYLNLTKNSSLGIAIAYPDLTHTIANTTLNQTNQAIETIAILMGIYLAISLITSAFMNWFNRRMALVER
jgi:general L-amino acid transport system permease protein